MSNNKTKVSINCRRAGFEIYMELYVPLYFVLNVYRNPISTVEY